MGRTGLNIGGFSTLEIEREEGESGSFALEGINFLVLFQPIEKIRAFMELEVGDLFMTEKPAGFRPDWLEGWDQLLAAIVFGLLAWLMVRMTRVGREEAAGPGA